MRGRPGGPTRRQAGDEGQEEGVGLARSGATPTEDIASGHRVGQGYCLDRGGLGDTEVREDVGERGGHAEGRESVSGHRCSNSEGRRGVLPGATRRWVAAHEQREVRPEAELGGPLTIILSDIRCHL